MTVGSCHAGGGSYRPEAQIFQCPAGKALACESGAGQIQNKQRGTYGSFVGISHPSWQPQHWGLARLRQARAGTGVTKSSPSPGRRRCNSPDGCGQRTEGPFYLWMPGLEKKKCLGLVKSRDNVASQAARSHAILLGGGKPCYSHTSPWVPLPKAGDPIPRQISSHCSAGAAVTVFQAA